MPSHRKSSFGICCSTCCEIVGLNIHWLEMLCSVMNGFMYCREDKKECRSSAPVIYILGIDSNFFHQHKAPFHGKQCKTTSKKCVLVGWAFEERAGIRMSAAKRAISGVQKLSLHRRRWKRALEWRRQAGCLSAALTTYKEQEESISRILLAWKMIIFPNSLRQGWWNAIHQ